MREKGAYVFLNNVVDSSGVLLLTYPEQPVADVEFSIDSIWGKLTALRTWSSKIVKIMQQARLGEGRADSCIDSHTTAAVTVSLQAPSTAVLCGIDKVSYCLWVSAHLFGEVCLTVYLSLKTSVPWAHVDAGAQIIRLTAAHLWQRRWMGKDKWIGLPVFFFCRFRTLLTYARRLSWWQQNRHVESTRRNNYFSAAWT